MSIRNKRELEATREKLHVLKDYYETARRKEGLNAQARDAILRSTKRMLNQLQEEIVRFEAHLGTHAKPE